MNKNVLKLIALASAILYIIMTLLYIDRLQDANTRLQNNQNVLMDSVHNYKVADSLNAAKINVLELSLSQYKKYREDDAALIKKLEAEKLAAISSVKTITITKIKTVVHDSLIYVSGQPIDTVKQFKYESKWTSINGYIDNDTISLNIKNREDLLIAESLTKKKLWFVKLPIKIFGYKTKSLDVVSKNPNTQITNLEYIQIYK